MAEERIVTNIVANADFSNLIADVQKVTTSLSKLQEQIASSNKMLANQVAVMNRSFSDTLRSTGQFSTHFVSLTSDVEKFGKNLDTGKLKLNQYFNAYQQHIKTSGGLIRDLARQQVQMQNAVLQPLGKNAQGLMQFNVHIPRGLDEIKNKSKIARQELQILNKVIQDGANQLVNWGKNTQWAGRQLTVGLTVPIAAFGKAAADAFRTADEQLVRLQKVYGGLAATSSTELAKVRKDVSATAKELASGLGASYNETLALAADIAATGKTGKELVGSIKETTRLAVLGEVDRQDAMKATLAIQTAFKQNTQQLSESINFLNAVENQTSTTLQDLIEAIPKAGPVIQGLGGSVKDLALYLTAMKEGGVSASEGANALKSALASLINPTKTASDMFASLGIDLRGIVTKDAGNLTQTLLDLQSALDQLNPLQKQQALEQLFGKFQFARMNALFENLGKQGSQTLQVLDLMKASSQDLANIAGRELSQVTESASGKYRRAIEGLKADLAGVGEQFLNLETKLINVIDKVIQFVNHLPGPIKQFMTLVGGLTALAGPVIMLTGVMANFIGYVLKGIMHMRSLFKGGEGWKLLTPEILAAQKAGSLVEQTFYSDAKAAAVLELALKNLIDEFTVLEQKAKAGTISLAPALQTMAGNAVAAGNGPRVVDPRHPMVGAPYSRASTHMVPRSGMSEQERLAQTVFGFVPGSIPVNRKIGNNPQVYMNEPLPNVPGLTSINGTSTGVVASEAAKWHAMMATLGMQSKSEVAALKKEIATTGVVSKDFMATFEQVLPAVSQITNNAAVESATIVSELRAGKLSVDQARQKIIALNLQIEQDIAAAAGAAATSMGKTLNPTVVPTLNQPVVDASGKSNMRELFKKSNTKSFIDKIARSLGVRTSGAGYNIETTIPKRFNSGNIVPGSGNTDTVPAMLTPGEFVVNKQATARNLPLLQAINGNGSSGPGYQFGSAQEIRAQYSGRELAHLTEMLYSAGLTADQSARIMKTFGVSYEDVKSPTARTGSSLTAAYHSFFNQGTNNGTLDIRKAIDYLSGKEVFDPKFGAVKHDPLLAYRHMMMDLGVPEAEMSNFARSIDSSIVAKLNASAQSGATVISDKVTGPHQVSTALLGDAVGEYVDSLQNPQMSNNLKKLRLPGEFRIQRPGGSSSARYFPKVTDKASSMLASIIAKKRMPQKMPNLKEIFPRAGKLFDTTAMEKAAYTKAMNSRMSFKPRLFRNSGGIIGLNDGGEVPGVPLNAGYRANLNASKTALGGTLRSAGAFAGSNAAYMVGATAGSAIGSKFGTIGSILGMIAGQGAVQGIMKLGTSLGSVTNIAKTLGGVLGRLTIPGAIITTAFTVGELLWKWKRHAEDVGKAHRAIYGPTKKSLEEVGLQYTSISDKIKTINENLKLQKEKLLANYAASTSSGVKGLTLTIQQLNDGIKNAKKNAKETVQDFNKLSGKNEVVKLAASLKQQYIAAGMSVQEATNTIYTLIKASDKGAYALDAITSKAFTGIKDKASGADYVIKLVTDSMKKTGIATEETTRGIENMLTSLDSYRLSLIGTKDAQGQIIDAVKAQQLSFDKIKGIKGTENKLNKDTLNTLKSQNLELASILGTAESLQSVYAKFALLQNGFASKLDLSSMSADQAVVVAQGMEAWSSSAGKAVDSTNGLKNAYDSLGKKIVTNNKIAAAAPKRDFNAEIKAIDKIIKALEKERDARLKLLDAQQQAADFNISIQKEQLAYQEALASGDMAAAAQAQLNIKQLSQQNQIEKAKTAINDQYQKKIDAQNAAKEKVQAAADASQTIATNAGTAATNYAGQQTAILNFKNTLQGIISGLTTKTFVGDTKKAAIQSLKEALASLSQGGGSASTLAKSYGTNYEKTLLDLISKTSADASSGPFADAVAKFVLAVDKFNGGIGPGGKQYKSYSANDLFGMQSYYTKAEGASSMFNKSGDKKGALNDDARTSLLMQNKGKNFNIGDYFQVNGHYYTVKASSGTHAQYGKEIIEMAQKATGGVINGPGTGTSDSIPAMLSNGEYVVNAASASKFGYGNLDRINKMALGGPVYNVPKMAVGGRINYAEAGPVGSSNVMYNVNVTLNGSDLSAQDVAQAIDRQMRMREAMNGRNRTV